MNMKIAFIFSTAIMTPTNGIKSQAFTWKRMLETHGHQVDMINQWADNDWQSYDAICFFLFNYPMLEFVKVLSKTNPNIFIAPIIDPHYSVLRLKLMSRWGSAKLKLTNEYYALRLCAKYAKGFLVRSNYEKLYVKEGLGVREDNIFKVPLSYGREPKDPQSLFPKENFCLHVSLLADPRKNVKRLVDAAAKYGFELKLAGRLRNDKERSLIHSWIDGLDNVEYLGQLSDDELENIYSRAKVFALPSTFEGVGLVALEAARRGCEIVLTNHGGPKEYYNGMARLVDANNVNEIGIGVKRALSDEDSHQPMLPKHIKENYSEERCVELLINSFK